MALCQLVTVDRSIGGTGCLYNQGSPIKNLPRRFSLKDMYAVILLWRWKQQ